MNTDWQEHAKRLGITADEIDKLTADAFTDLIKRIRSGEDPQIAINAIMQAFEPAYLVMLSAAFSDTLKRSVGVAELKGYIIGDVVLSRRLYQHAQETSIAVREIIRQHAAGWHDARRLAMQIYEGYGFQIGEDPLQWSARSPKWPRYMREAVTQDPTIFPQYRTIARQMAGNIKTPALRASYMEALDALEKKSRSLDRRLEVAFQERMRYHANRIAQTELHRAWVDNQAREIMDDDSIEVVQVKMSSTHPRIDICDMFATQDKYGLGPGLYPKGDAPKPPFHPHCRCGLISKRLISASGAKENPASERIYLRQVMEKKGIAEASKIVGSRAKLAVALTQAPISEVVNINRPMPYKLAKVGQN